jgi:uncharacterized protein with PQ loop repeat
VPQLLRLLSHRDTTGVSVATWWLTAVAGLTWVIHNVRHDEVVAAVTNGWSAAVAAAILYRCYRDNATPQPVSAFAIPLVATLIDVAVFVLAPDHLGWIAAGIGVVQFAPQARIVLTAERLSGVSFLTWLLAVIAAALWIIYGVLHSDAAIIASPLFTGSLSLLIVVRLAVRRTVRREAT